MFINLCLYLVCLVWLHKRNVQEKQEEKNKNEKIQVEGNHFLFCFVVDDDDAWIRKWYKSQIK